MMESGAPEPTITGVVDNDRTSWGDPESDWTIFMAARKHQMRDVLDQLQA